MILSLYCIVLYCIVLYNIVSVFRGGEGSKLYDKIKLEKEKENSKLNRQQRKQDKMLFVAFYILLNLVRQSALYFPRKFLFAFSLHLFLFASFGYRGKQSLRHTSILRWNHVCCIFDFTFLCPSMRLDEPILSFPILISFCCLSFFLFSSLSFLRPFFPPPPPLLFL
jgi:D-alanyl-lipoteichoic acid acyltransferase DltB (MBOAT superfamily)